jgi:2,3-dihydroxybenzoate-AMP ligase
VVLANDPSATLCFPLIEQHQINVTSLVPPAVSLWLQAIAEGAGNAQLQSLKLLQVGGARLSATLAARIPAEIGCQLQQVFGMAEGLVNYTALDDARNASSTPRAARCARTTKCGWRMSTATRCRAAKSGA